jgi:hypothetical protein
MERMRMTLDLLFLAKNRLEFTRAAWRALMGNTDWDRVSHAVAYDDGSDDGAEEALIGFEELRQTEFGSPVLVCNDFVRQSQADLVAKIDNDTMLPPGWLGICLEIFERHPELELLGLEAYGYPEVALGRGPYGYEPADHVGGIFVARRRIFETHPLPKADGTFYGFTDWQKEQGIVRGWIRPRIPVFQLDRVPLAPWAELSARYEALGWQRWWRRYEVAEAELWKWAFCG